MLALHGPINTDQAAVRQTSAEDQPNSKMQASRWWKHGTQNTGRKSSFSCGASQNRGVHQSGDQGTVPEAGGVVSA